mmetsp:Transcript_104864/g.146195  ORF Transcript_104864/g.146195 Transcript_104864/m.146195 type:complete len:216 (+) Transcript_104864:114-761(+)
MASVLYYPTQIEIQNQQQHMQNEKNNFPCTMFQAPTYPNNPFAFNVPTLQHDYHTTPFMTSTSHLGKRRKENIEHGVYQQIPQLAVQTQNKAKRICQSDQVNRVDFGRKRQRENYDLCESSIEAHSKKSKVLESPQNEFSTAIIPYQRPPQIVNAAPSFQDQQQFVMEDANLGVAEGNAKVQENRSLVDHTPAPRMTQLVVWKDPRTICPLYQME